MKTTLTRPRSEINVTPYIDILLVLLIIFMVIQPTAQYQLQARVPQNQRSKLAKPQPTIVVSIDSDLRLRINSIEVGFAGLGERLFEILRGRADKRLFIEASEELPFGSVVKVIDVAKGAGAGEIGLLSAR